MRLNEIKKFDSIVYNILERAVDRGVDVNFDLSMVDIGVNDKYGEIVETNYWSTEGIINIVYMTGEAGTPARLQHDWRYRPMTGAMFDEMFTIKKVDGVLTFMKREQHGE